MVEKYYLFPLKISLIIGILSIIINIIGFTIYCLIINDFRLFTDCLDFSEKNKLVISIYFILYILISTAAFLTLFLSVYYFSPTLILVTNIISPLLLWIFKTIIEGASTIENILYPIGYIITLFSTVIYNELIIFNCCNLNKDTKKYVNKRINKELEEIQKSEEILVSGTDDDDSSMANTN